MIRKLKDIKIYGLIFTIISAVFILVLSTPFFSEPRLQPFLFDAGVACLGSMTCAALFYGCMKQEGDGARPFRILILLLSACFVVNEGLHFTAGVPELGAICFICCLLSKLIDLVMIDAGRGISKRLSLRGEPLLFRRDDQNSAPKCSIESITTLQSGLTFCMTSFIWFIGIATQPPVKGLAGARQCRKIAEPAPGLQASL